MPGFGGRDYYIISAKGERGPVDRAELRELLAGAEILDRDQVRNAFGRNLGTVAQVLATPSERQGVSSGRTAAPAPHVPPPRRPAVPVVALVIGLLLAGAAALWLAGAPSVPRQEPAPPPVPTRPVAAPPRAPAPQADPVQGGAPRLAEPPAPAPGADGLPAGWSTHSIGNDGSAPPEFADGMWNVHGAGHDIWGVADQFRLVQTAAPEQATLTAQLISSDGRDQWAKAGVMLRLSAEPGSPYVALTLSPKGQILLHHRSKAAAPATGETRDTGALPLWLRLVRQGTAVSAKVSNNGSQWRSVGEVEAPGFHGQVLAGLAVCSKLPGKPATACYDSVTLTTP